MKVMTESLFDIFSRKDFSEPPEIAAIKGYVREHFEVEIEVVPREYDIVLSVPGAALASVLRFHARKLQAAAKTKKRLIIRIR